ncbi:MAG: TraB/GumN family protein [Desulfuromonadales bacterium]|nr:TraB/GumN family protein [Desulfuromonadales bacterium]
MTPSDIHRIQLGDSEVVLIGTAHISQESIDTVRQVITAEQPDCVCIELDEQRCLALKDKNHWENLNIYQVVRKGQAAFLMANLALSSFQKRMGLQTGVKPGSELFAAIKAAEEQNATVELIDRNIRTTLLRAWRNTGLWKKINLVSVLFASMFDKTELDEEELSKLRQSDTLSAMLEELGDLLPTVKGILVDERDQYMAHHIRKAKGDKIVVVVGAAHLPGILKRLQGDEILAGDKSIEEINSIPPKSTISKIVPWAIPGVVILLFVFGFFYGNTDRLADAAFAWILANGILSAIGAMLAFAHPLTILTAFIAAPLTSLNPTIGAGMVTGVVQAMVAAPTVHDLENVSEDMTSLRGWWSNRTTRVLLVFFLSSLGSAIGTFVAFGWLKNLF